MDVARSATSCIAGQPTISAVEAFNPMWRTLRRLLPKFTAHVTHSGYPESGEHRRLATGEAAS